MPILSNTASSIPDSLTIDDDDTSSHFTDINLANNTPTEPHIPNIVGEHSVNHTGNEETIEETRIREITEEKSLLPLLTSKVAATF
jgi:hypothetical protein